jgi:uncharacterized DUF497 family protein
LFRYEWDPNKARINEQKHGTTFGRAATVFLDPGALTIFDSEHSENEERWITLGLDASGALLVVCHTFDAAQDDEFRVRIISARKATAVEARQYREVNK